MTTITYICNKACHCNEGLLYQVPTPLAVRLRFQIVLGGSSLASVVYKEQPVSHLYLGRLATFMNDIHMDML